MAVAAMIVAGNRLWINNRATQKNISIRAIHFVDNMTVGSCRGFVMAKRSEMLAAIYVAVTLFSIIGAYWVTNKKVLITCSLYVAVGLLLMTVVTEWRVFFERFLAMQSAV